MSLGDIQVLREGAFGLGPVEKFAVAAGAVASINAGEPVSKALSAAVVASLATNKPEVASDFLAGIAMTTSTDTVAAAGTVDVLKLVPGVVYMCAGNDLTAIDTQAEYDALVGNRVLFDKTAGVYTVLVADNANNGLVIEPLDIAKYPGMIAFSLRQALSYSA